MKTVCTGWTKPAHSMRVLKNDGIRDGLLSHGMCPECVRAMSDQLSALEVRKKTLDKEEGLR